MTRLLFQANLLLTKGTKVRHIAALFVYHIKPIETIIKMIKKTYSVYDYNTNETKTVTIRSGNKLTDQITQLGLKAMDAKKWSKAEKLFALVLKELNDMYLKSQLVLSHSVRLDRRPGITKGAGPVVNIEIFNNNKKHALMFDSIYNQQSINPNTEAIATYISNIYGGQVTRIKFRSFSDVCKTSDTYAKQMYDLLTHLKKAGMIRKDTKVPSAKTILKMFFQMEEVVASELEAFISAN